LTKGICPEKIRERFQKILDRDLCGQYNTPYFCRNGMVNMRLSTKSRYGARALLQLALAYGQGPVHLKEIAQKQQISIKYLEQLIASLKAAGIVKSVRGAKGGDLLSRPPEEIGLSEIFLVLEGSLAPVECVDDAEVCERADFCATREVWKQIKECLDKVLGPLTLKDLVERHREKTKPQELMYYI
jgi:Rrf2 family protein